MDKETFHLTLKMVNNPILLVTQRENIADNSTVITDVWITDEFDSFNNYLIETFKIPQLFDMDYEYINKEVQKYSNWFNELRNNT